MRLLKASRPFFIGGRTVTPEDPPFEVPDNRAADLVNQGLASYHMQLAMSLEEPEASIDPGPPRAQRAVAPPLHRKRA